MKTTFHVIFTFLFLFFQTYGASSSNIMITASSNVTCIERERQSLLVFRQGLTGESNRLPTWTGVECCVWQGVGCDGRNGHVVKLDLRSPLSFIDNYTLNTSNLLEGKVSSSLLNLKHLRYLDLSMNNFWGQNIPEFFGSFKYLEYLNLSFSGFSGVVPPHLGNLSSLQYLDLNNNLQDRYELSLLYDVSLMVKDDMWWLSTLSSLKHLDLSGINLGNHTDWLHSVNMLPSLVTLNLASCDISNIPSIQFINFTSLNSLDLSHNDINSTIPVWLSNLTGLMHLHLHYNSFHGRIPGFVGKLSFLSSIYFYHNQLSGSIPESIGLLTRLESLRLSNNQLSGSIPENIGLLTSLEILTLWNNQLSGNIPTSLGQLSNLQDLDLSYNSLDGVLSEIHFTKLNNLTGLWLTYNSLTLNVSPHWIPPFHLIVFRGRSCNMGPQFPNWLQTQTDLEYLDLSFNQLTGSIPESIGLLMRLKELYLRNNQLSGSIPESIGLLTRLTMLHLQHNQLNGSIPESIGQLSMLEDLYLGNNQLSGSIPKSIGLLTRLQGLYLTTNQLSGNIPTSLGQLSNLIVLDLHKNSLDGVVSEILFTKLNNLTGLSLADNSLTLNVSPHWIPPFQLKVFDGSSSNIGPQFPNWLKTQTHLEELMLSNSSIRDGIPEWFHNISSHIKNLDLSYNKIRGRLPRMNPGLEIVVLAKNGFTGSVPTHLCELHGIKLLDLSQNNFFGILPDCLGSLTKLQVIDLSDNTITGDVLNSLGSLSYLQSLHLQNNKFEGNLPVSLQNLTRLVTMDLGNNLLTGKIPFWIGKKLSKLKILNLQSNKFIGKIPLELCQIKVLQYLNLANNSIIGTIPHCFGKLTGMIMISSDAFGDADGEFRYYYEENIVASIKGIQWKYTKTIRFLTSLDLSNNNITGEIPNGLMNLVALKNLNLSRNLLSGEIPLAIGNLKQIESLDLSMNKLSGQIPQSLSSLNYLSHLNLSFNNLFGAIPAGNQLQTLNESSIYEGNTRLCGPPLSSSCKGNDSSYNNVGSRDEGQDDTEGLYFYVGMATGFVVGFIGLLGSLHFIRSWRIAYFKTLENVYGWLVLSIHLNLARFRRKFF